MYRLMSRALTAASLGLVLTAVGSAQSTRTWVSGVGDDGNPCSRTAPCKTFAGALSKTSVNGEINCLDPGGFGNIVITKSITIDCHGMVGTILYDGPPSNGNIFATIYGINIAFDSFDGSDSAKTVNIRNLTFQGWGVGGIGISISGGGAGSLVNIEDCVLSG